MEPAYLPTLWTMEPTCLPCGPWGLPTYPVDHRAYLPTSWTVEPAYPVDHGAYLLCGYLPPSSQKSMPITAPDKAMHWST